MRLSREGLRQLRRALGVSQNQMVKDTSLSRARISMYECGYIDLLESELEIIHDYLIKRQSVGTLGRLK